MSDMRSVDVFTDGGKIERISLDYCIQSCENLPLAWNKRFEKDVKHAFLLYHPTSSQCDCTR